jgi:hypothetical protein
VAPSCGGFWAAPVTFLLRPSGLDAVNREGTADERAVGVSGAKQPVRGNPFEGAIWVSGNEGLVCEHGVPNSGQVAVFAALEMTAEQWDVKKADLISLGASETNEPVSEYLQEPEVDINVSRGGFVFGDGILQYVSSDYLVQWIR